MKRLIPTLIMLAACAGAQPQQRPAESHALVPPQPPHRGPASDYRGPSVDAKVMSVSTQAGIVIINQGNDSGVRIGTKFTIYRGNQFVATAIVRETTREWSSLTIDLKYLDPQTGDDASNRLP
jgi:hypothetical protein